jgi:hypothetical protein
VASVDGDVSNELGPRGSEAHVIRSNTPGEWPVAVFAHDEEDHILETLGSLDDPRVHAYVLANACTDATERLVKAYAQTHPGVTLVSIPLGDKANAWNVFVHEVAPEAAAYYFIDGDITASPHALLELTRALDEHPEANAAAAIPGSGQSREEQARLVIDHRLVMGALYALSGAFVARLRAGHVKVPVGYIGEDGWVTSMAKWDGDPRYPWREDRVVPCPAAGYVYSPLSMWRPGDWRTHLRRQVRYSLRHFQHLLWRDALLADGLAGMPDHIRDLYGRPSLQPLLRARRRELIFDWLALKEIRRTRG